MSRASAIARVSTDRATLGANQNRLRVALDNDNVFGRQYSVLAAVRQSLARGYDGQGMCVEADLAGSSKCGPCYRRRSRPLWRSSCCAAPRSVPVASNVVSILGMPPGLGSTLCTFT